ncbi:hypothetical protein [Francisella sp. 19X1-34]|uniref:hypothetical protein n=1 Tax=Francisella sp. 19X1-34 TaxID=3087177 RepID=UPI002E330D26|nr:hypothetical protein [Francisella sp. 19X1-34]MED7788668.1 hypothetical protein [Francisella sp. 19X1-34]
MGVVYVYLYIISFIASQILVYKIGQNYNAFFVLFLSCTIAIIFFNFVEACKGKLRQNFSFVFGAKKKEFIIVSIYVSLMWVFSYLATVESSARFSITVDFLAAFAYVNLIYRKFSLLNFIGSSLSIITIILCIVFMPEHSVMGVISGILTGVFTGMYRITAFNFSSKYSFSSTAILSIRLFFLWGVSLLLWLIFGDHIVATIDSIDSIRIILIFIVMAMLGMILPSFFSQVALYKLKPYIYSRFVTTVPVIVLVFQGVVMDDWSIPSFIICLVATIILNLESLLKAKG